MREGERTELVDGVERKEGIEGRGWEQGQRIRKGKEINGRRQTGMGERENGGREARGTGMEGVRLR